MNTYLHLSIPSLSPPWPTSKPKNGGPTLWDEPLTEDQSLERDAVTPNQLRHTRSNFTTDVSVSLSLSQQVVVPKPIDSTHSVLIMEYVPGKLLIDALQEHVEVIARERGMTVEEQRLGGHSAGLARLSGQLVLHRLLLYTVTPFLAQSGLFRMRKRLRQ